MADVYEDFRRAVFERCVTLVAPRSGTGVVNVADYVSVVSLRRILNGYTIPTSSARLDLFIEDAQVRNDSLIADCAAGILGIFNGLRTLAGIDTAQRFFCQSAPSPRDQEIFLDAMDTARRVVVQSIYRWHMTRTTDRVVWA